MSVAPASVVVAVGPGELHVSSLQVARYAGGGRYRPDASQQGRIGAALEWASRLVRAAYVYRLYAVTHALSGGAITLDDHTTLPMPLCAQDSGLQYLAVCICTLGKKLDQAVREVMSEGKGTEGLLLDAAGVALLDALGAHALDALRVEAQGRRLHCSGRFGPGYRGVALSFQKRVFALVDAASIDVRLNECCLMTPEKSLSLFAEFTTTPAPPASPNKCDSCHLTRCLYRC